ncbi:MAG: hypothetical protein JWQ35_634 [Bacteriovoracaceae bacterium]|nr:hypothetical protein [Bacteriovoracaceae bacterium]
MGIFNRKLGIVLISSAACVGAISSAYSEENKILERLEKGEVISAKTGASFFMQALVQKDSAKIEAAFSDLSKLPAVFPQIAFARPYVEGKGDSARKFLYLKLRGLGDGVSVLMEVKSGGDEAFVNAKELILGGDIRPSRDTSAEVDSSKESNQLALDKSIDAANESDSKGRFLGAATEITLEGPLNELMEMPTVRATINLGIQSFGESPSALKTPALKGLKLPAASKRTYLVAKVSFGNQMPNGELGDIHGFGEARLSLAQQIGVNIFSTLRGNLEKF